MQRNRESAQQSRQRKRMQMDEVEQRCEQFKQHNSQLNQLVGRLTAENMGLKQQLVHICQQTGHPLPPPPPSTMHPYGFGQMGLPQVPAPKVRRLFLPGNLTCCCVSSVAEICYMLHLLSLTASLLGLHAHTNCMQACYFGKPRQRALLWYLAACCYVASA